MRDYAAEMLNEVLIPEIDLSSNPHEGCNGFILGRETNFPILGDGLCGQRPCSSSTSMIEILDSSVESYHVL